uniref:Uncharacterized protein n=1 Tax=Solanum tuberosum TaxID=4113 RepID=M1A0C2_SOLTU
MLYKATLTLLILFIFLGGLFFPVAPTRMTSRVNVEKLGIPRGIQDPGDRSPRGPVP